MIIDHHAPIESSVYARLILDIENRIRYAQRQYFNNRIENTSGDQRDFYIRALSLFDDDGLSWLWIEKTEPSSCKCEGKGRNRILYALLGALGFFATDVVDETQIYKDAKEASIYAADLGYEYLREMVAGLGAEFLVEVDKDGDTIFITYRVHPFIEEKYRRVSRVTDGRPGVSS